MLSEFDGLRLNAEAAQNIDNNYKKSCTSLFVIDKDDDYWEFFETKDGKTYIDISYDLSGYCSLVYVSKYSQEGKEYYEYVKDNFEEVNDKNNPDTVPDPDPDAEISPLKIEVSDITGAGATITVTCSTDEYFCWEVATPEDLAAYDNPYLYWVNEQMITEEYYNENADAFAEYYGVNSYDEVKAMYLRTTEDTYDYKKLDPETEYVVYAFRLNKDLTLKSTLIDTVHFTTLEGPSEEYYQLEPTTPITLNMNAIQAQCTAYGNIFNKNSVNFSVVLINAEGKGLVLDMNAANGSETIPAGTYEAAIVTAADQIAPGMIIAGNLALYQNGVGSYAVLSDSEALWIENGSLTVQVADGNYTISGTLTSHYGSTVNVSYTGALVPQQPQQAAKKVAKPIFSLDVKGHVFNRK
ncbi:MAG: hypothetical protein ACI4AW_04220 [Paludibacteraceae bacterium]